MKTFDMQSNNIAYSNFRNANTMSRLTQDSTNGAASGITPMSKQLNNFSKHGNIESDTYTLKGGNLAPIHSFSPKSINKIRKRGIEQS